MSIIKCIRVFRSKIENVSGNSLPEDFVNKQLDCTLKRITMKLRENGFTLGDFDHLYINLSICPMSEQMTLSKRGKDEYHPWYRYYDVEIDQDLYDALETEESVPSVVEIVDKVLQQFFSNLGISSELIHSFVTEAVSQGEKMEMLFKSKTTTNRKALVFLRFLNTAQYYPLLRVYDSDGALLFEKDLPKTNELNAYGEILLNKKSVTIKPRKNSFTKHIHSMTFVFEPNGKALAR